MQKLDPLSEAIVNKAIDNITKKVIAGFRNKKNSQPNKKEPNVQVDINDTLKAASASSAMEVANRGVAWKEMIQKSISHGVSSLSTLNFDGQFKVENGIPVGMNNLPSKPGIYVIYDKNNQPCYVGDSENMKSRWYAGHLNEFKQKEKNDKKYKLSNEFKEGCTVKFIVCDSKETAAAIEAHLIREGKPRVNSKEELLDEQGTRSNQEAKKMKDASGSTESLLAGTAKESIKNISWDIAEQLIANAIKAIKNEIVDILHGTKCDLSVRIERVVKVIWEAIKGMIQEPLAILRGFFEFVINAMSEAIRKIYNLAKNIWDLCLAAYKLHKASASMSQQELIQKITEIIVVSGSLILWDAFDAILETNLITLFPALAAFAPFLSAVISAIGFGVTSYYFSLFIPQIINMLFSIKLGLQEANKAMAKQAETLVTVATNNINLLYSLENYMISSKKLLESLDQNTKKLSKTTVSIQSTNLASEVHLLLSAPSINYD